MLWSVLTPAIALFATWTGMGTGMGTGTEAEPGDAWTPPVPVAPPPSQPSAGRAPGTPEILYVNFDGGVLQTGCGNDAKRNCSTLADLFSGYVGPFTGDLNQRMAVLQAVRRDIRDFGIRVVTDRPPDDTAYTMVMYGDLGEQSFAGIAPYIDCEDVRPDDNSFTQGFNTSNTGSTVVLQEAAHTWGLEHVDAEFDIMNPFKAAGNNQSFEDICHRIVANTDLEPTPGSCNQIHTLFCDAGFQNSYQEMLHLFGPAIPDTSAPQIEITHPEPGATFVLPITFSLTADILDDNHPQFYTVRVLQNGQELFDDNDVTVDLRLIDPPPADYELMVEVRDEAGNVSQAPVTFTVLPEGSELPQKPGPDFDDSDRELIEDGCRVGDGPRGGWLMLPVLVALRRRRAAA